MALPRPQLHLPHVEASSRSGIRCRLLLPLPNSRAHSFSSLLVSDFLVLLSEAFQSQSASRITSSQSFSRYLKPTYPCMTDCLNTWLCKLSKLTVWSWNRDCKEGGLHPKKLQRESCWLSGAYHALHAKTFGNLYLWLSDVVPYPIHRRRMKTDSSVRSSFRWYEDPC